MSAMNGVSSVNLDTFNKSAAAAMPEMVNQRVHDALKDAARKRISELTQQIQDQTKTTKLLEAATNNSLLLLEKLTATETLLKKEREKVTKLERDRTSPIKEMNEEDQSITKIHQSMKKMNRELDSVSEGVTKLSASEGSQKVTIDSQAAEIEKLKKKLSDEEEAAKVLKSELAIEALLKAQTDLIKHKLGLAQIQAKIHEAQISNLTGNHNPLNQMCRNRFYVMNEGEVPKFEHMLKAEETRTNSLESIIAKAIAIKDASSITNVQKVIDLEKAAKALLDAQTSLLQRELYLAGKQAEIHKAQIHNLRWNHGPINMAFRNRFKVMNEGKVPKLIETLNNEKISLPKLVQAAENAKKAYEALKNR